tara:strand:- start:338 stop:523 length:186 start_codon:yes stop_codon:yes gene_type:complete
MNKTLEQLEAEMLTAEYKDWSEAYAKAIELGVYAEELEAYDEALHYAKLRVELLRLQVEKI